MTEIGFLLDAGAVAFTDARAVANARVFQRCLTYAAGLDALVVGHPQDPALSEGACATTGQFASQLGLPDVSPVAERIALERDLALVELTGARYHADQLSTAAGLPALAPRPRGRPRRDRRRLDPPPDAERVRRRRLPDLLQARAAAPLRGRPDGDGRGAGRRADRRRRLVPHAAGRGGEAPALRGGRERRRRPRDAAPGGDAAPPRRPPDAAPPLAGAGAQPRAPARPRRRAARPRRARRPRALRPRHAVRARPRHAALEVEEHPLRPPPHAGPRAPHLGRRAARSSPREDA